MAEMLYMQVAEDLSTKIQKGILAIDEKLSERKLAAEYSVSRTVVREAVKVLNEKGMVHTVYGKGTYVNLPDEQVLMSKLRDVLDVSKVKQSEVFEAREILEFSMFPYMLERVDEESIQMLEELDQEMKDCVMDGAAYVECDEKFHLVCSICTHNRVLNVMTGTLNQLADRKRFMEDVSIRRKANEEHQIMIEALKKKDGALLRDILLDHVHRVRSCAENEEKE